MNSKHIMKKTTVNPFVIFLLVSIVMLSSIGYVQAQLSQESFSIYSPNVMLEGETYSLMVTYDGINQQSLELNIFSEDPLMVQIIDDHATIKPTEGQALFKVFAKKEGETKIFAIVNEVMFEKTIKIQKPALLPQQLELIVPANTVKVREIPAYVVLKDSFDNPVSAAQDIEMTVTTFGNVKSETQNIVIPKNSHYVSFKAEVFGDGGINIAAQEFNTDTEYIQTEKEKSEVELRVRVAPNPIGASSFSEVYVWLEKDDAPYVPGNDMEITLASQNEDFLTFQKDARYNSLPTTQSLTSTTKIILEKGSSFTKTRVYATDFISEFNPGFGSDLRHVELTKGQAAEVFITAIASGVGGDEAKVLVTPSVGLTSAQFSTQSNQNFVVDPSVTKVWAYPDPAMDNFEIVMAPFIQLVNATTKNQAAEEELEKKGLDLEELDERESDDDNNNDDNNNDDNNNDDNNNDDTDGGIEGVSGEEQDEYCDKCIPIIIVEENLMAHVTTNDLGKTLSSSEEILSSSFRTNQNYAVFDATTTGKLGEMQINGVVDGTEGDKINIDVDQPFSSETKLQITPIPSIDFSSPVAQDLFMVYPTVGDSISDFKIDDLFISSKPQIKINEIRDVGFVKIVNGVIQSTSSETIEIAALAEGIEGVEGNLSIFNPEIKDILVNHPDQVRTELPFPFVVYATDHMGNPVKRIYDSQVSPSEAFVDSQSMSEQGLAMLPANMAPKIVIFKEGLNPTTTSFKVLDRTVSLSIDTQPPKNTKVGAPFQISYSVIPEDSIVKLKTKLNYEKTENGFKVVPLIGGMSDIQITASRQGFVDDVQSFQVNVIDDNVQPVEVVQQGFDPMILYSLIAISIGLGGFVFYKRFVKGKMAESSKSKIKKKGLDDDNEEDLTF